ncbi:ORF015 [Saltwater crocodilepox virus]|nr:ORF015 [Saltwater crocodilepox virus]QGT49025.1 ORF015 [Saltwater crocodilepox virus]
MDTLPPELLEKVFSFLEDRDLCACRGTRRAWLEIIDAGPTWVRRFKQRFGFWPAEPALQASVREVYQRFPAGRNLLPAPYRNQKNINYDFDLFAMGCHPCVMRRRPTIAISDQCHADSNMTYYHLILEFLTETGELVRRHREDSVGCHSHRVSYRLAGYGKVVRYVCVCRYSEYEGLELRVYARADRRRAKAIAEK